MAAPIDYDLVPALLPPAGAVLDVFNSRAAEPLLAGTAIACVSLTTVCTAVRLYTKIVILKQVNVEDYLLVLATLGFAAFAGVLLSNNDAGQGQHQWNMSMAHAGGVALLVNVSEIIYAPVMFAAKAAVLLSLKRIFTTGQRNGVHWAFVLLLVLNSLFYLSIFFVGVFACVPRDKIHRPWLDGTCISADGLILATSAFNILSDVSILCLPLIVVWSLQTPLKRKITAAAVFATGFFGCVSSILRLYYSIRLSLTDDFTWGIYPVGVWALAELATVILVCCFPVFPRFFHHFRKPAERSEEESSRKSGRANSCGHLNRGVYAESTLSAMPWDSSSAERVMRNGGSVELDVRNLSNGGRFASRERPDEVSLPIRC